MRADPLDVLIDPNNGSPGPRIVEASSAEIAAVLAGAAERIGSGQLRYYLAAGSGVAPAPLWAFPAEPGQDRRSVLCMVEDVLHCREERAAAVEHELTALAAWLSADPDPATPDPASKVLVAEIFGPVTRDQVAFLNACGQRLWHRSDRLRMVVLRHAAPAGARTRAATEPLADSRETDEILLALHLAGGHATAAEMSGWAGRRDWNPDTVAALTTSRPGRSGPLYTYAGTREWARAQAVRDRASPEVLSALATMVTTRRDGVGRTTVPLSTAVLAEDPAVALSALDRLGCAVAAHRPATLLEFCRSVLHTAWRHRWSEVDRSTAYALYLAAFVSVGRGRLSPAASDRVLAIAERTGVDAGVCSLLGYHLGQILAKSRGPACWDASMRHFAYARERIRATPGSSASRIAASYNGEALARYRAGDRDGAVRAELAGLAALSGSDVPATSAMAEQRVLLLANLADVHARSNPDTPEAVRCGQQAFRIAVDADSLVALTYVVPNLVRRLLDRDWPLEAERVARQLLRRYDRDVAPRRAAERAVVNVCCRLAAARLAEGAAGAAAGWYAEAALRMRRAAPEALEGIVRNLRALDDAHTATLLERLDAELTAHRATRESLSPLVGLLSRR